jgi:hypothetical protein
MADLNIIGSFQDNVNKDSGINRKFVFNRGDYSIQSMTWVADLVEVIEAEEVLEETRNLTTDEGDLITTDSDEQITL